MNNDTQITSDARLFSFPEMSHLHFEQPIMGLLCKRRNTKSLELTNERQPDGTIKTPSGTVYAPYQTGWRRIS